MLFVTFPAFSKQVVKTQKKPELFTETANTNKSHLATTLVCG